MQKPPLPNPQCYVCGEPVFAPRGAWFRWQRWHPDDARNYDVTDTCEEFTCMATMVAAGFTDELTKVDVALFMPAAPFDIWMKQNEQNQ